MEIIFEFFFSIIFELVIEGINAVIENQKIPKPVRYPLAVFMFLLLQTVPIFIFIIGASIIAETLFGGLFIIAVGAVLSVIIIIRFRKLYLKKRGY